ncbi:MAG: TIGR02099 family protein [Aeromonadales bacterium]|nr:TIGR02099 family protein [Aeromonadales bacterium]
MLRRSLNWGWLSLAVLAVLMALLITVLRFGSPYLNQWQQQWVDKAFSNSELAVTIGELGLSWRDFGPVLVVKDVQLVPESGPPMKLERALVDMQLWQSLRQWQPVLNELILEDLYLPIEVSRDASSMPDIDWQQLRRLVLTTVERFTLTQAQVVFTSAEQQVLSALYVSNLQWQNSPDLHQGQGRLGVSPDPEQQLDFRGHLTGSSEQLTGGVYLAADELDISSLFSHAGLPAQVKQPTQASLDFELWLEWQQGQLSAGIWQLGENYLRLDEHHQIQVDRGRVQWQPTEHGWQLASQNIDIKVDGEPWLAWSAQLDKQDEQLVGYLDQLTFTDLALVAQWGEVFWPSLAHQLANIRPSGRLANLYYSAVENGKQWRWQGDLLEVSTQAFEWVPATQGLNGHFSFGANGGALSIEQLAASDWQYQQAFRAPWPMQTLSSEVRWQQQKAGDWWLWSDKLDVVTKDVALQGWFSLHIPLQGSPMLSASAHADVLRAEQAYRYFPEPLMGSALVDYLQGAIRGGQAQGAKVMWYGALDAFPYQDNQGIFQAKVPLRDAQFRFDPDWQPLSALDLDLLFENDNLYMKGEEGLLGSVTASQIKAQIVPLDEDANLELSAHIQGEGEAVTSYLQSSALADSVGITLEQLQVTGPLSGQLALTIPLNEGEVLVNGHVDFAQNNVLVKPLDLPLSKVSGRLHFDEQKTRFDELQAHWLGQPLQLTYRGQEVPNGYEVQLDLSGQLNSDALANAYPMLDVLSGEGRWRGKLDLTLPEQGPLQYQFRADSDLVGLASQLPAPLKKTKSQAWATHLEVQGNDERAGVSLKVGPDIQGESQLRFEPQLTVDRLWLSLGPKPATAARAPLDIAVRLADLTLDDWLAQLSQWQTSASKAQSSASSFSLPHPYRVSLHASRAQLWEQPLNQLHLSLRPAAHQMQQLDIEAEQVKGRVTFGSQQVLQANFERLWLSSLEPNKEKNTAAGQAEPTFSPQQVPAVQFSCEDCRWQKLALGKVNFELAPQPKEDSVALRNLYIDGPLLTLQANGQWLQHSSGNLSRLEWQTSTPSLQRLWQSLDKDSPFSETSAELQGKVRWLDVPWQPQLATMDGELALSTGAGVLKEVSDKGAGLLSVVSLESVMRRLRLDFRDIYAKGFYFDRIIASGKLRNGILHNHDLLLKGAAGDLQGKGEVNFATEQIDYHVELLPNLTANLPVVAAFAVTPVTGLYVFALSKVLGPVVDVFTRIRYHVTGTLDDPVVSEQGRDKDQVKLAQ